MGVYESNYLRLLDLTGPLVRLPAATASIVRGDCELHLAVLERARFTMDIALTYLLPERLPDFRLRVYHDARLVEVMPGERRAERELRQCWSRNMMLNKWLDYCVERGHRFC
jgi:uncharacterized protein YqiB (DUF1249 family)